MVLRTDGRSFAVAQAAPDFLILAEPNQIPPGDAELSVTIDGETSKFQFAILQAVNGRRATLEDASVPGTSAPKSLTAV